jgi:hypothetical protein
MRDDGSRLNPQALIHDQRNSGNSRRPLSRTNVREHEGDDPADAALIERDADSLVAAPDRVAAPNKLIGFD